MNSSGDVRGRPEKIQNHETIYIFDPPDISASPQGPMPWISNNGRISPKFIHSSIPNTKIYKTMSSYVYFDMVASFLLSLCHDVGATYKRNPPYYEVSVSDSLYNYRMDLF